MSALVARESATLSARACLMSSVSGCHQSACQSPVRSSREQETPAAFSASLLARQAVQNFSEVSALRSRRGPFFVWSSLGSVQLAMLSTSTIYLLSMDVIVRLI